MKRYPGIYILRFILMIFPGIPMLHAQGWGTEGEIEDAQVIIEKSRDIVLPQVTRNFEKVPPLPVEINNNLLQPYQFTPVPGILPVLPMQPRVLKLKEEPLDRLYRGYLRGGFGTYLTPYFDGYLYNKREKNFLTGIRFHHLSSGYGPVGKGNSSNGDTRLEVSGNYYKGPLTLGADAGYEHAYWNFYGYPSGSPVDRDSLRQHFNRIHIHGYIQSDPKKSNTGFLLNVNYSHLADHFKTSESLVRADLDFRIPIQENLSFGLTTNAMFSVLSDTGTRYRNLVKFDPALYYRYQDLEVKAGLNTVIQNDTVSSRSPVLLYPFVGLTYHFTQAVSGYLNFDGDMEEVTLHSLTGENPYLNENLPVYHTNKAYGLEWGVKANISNLAFARAGFSYASLKDMYYFLNDSLNISRFNIVYDRGSTNRTWIYGELNLSKPGLYLFDIKGNYYHYQVDELEQPWHKPAWKVDLLSRYNIYRKIILSADLYFMGGIKARDYILDKVITLKPVNDINFTIDYLFSEKFSVFLDFKNILGNNYEIYWRYPSRGLQFMAGASINF